MPAVTPKGLRPYVCHGLDPEYREGQDDALCECPFCGKENKFSINVEEGTWRCFSCNQGKDNGKVYQGGNVFTFLRILWQQSMDSTSEEDYQELAEHRRLLYPDTLQAWGCCKSLITGDWLVPGYNVDGKLMQLYRYLQVGDRWALQLTSELGHQLMGVPLFDPKKEEVCIMEGCWDAMCLWETLRHLKDDGGDYVETKHEKYSLLQDYNIIAVPSCSSFSEKWLPLFAGKEVSLLYDSDHPKQMCKDCKKTYSTVDNTACPLCNKEPKGDALLIPSPGYQGMIKVSQMFSTADEKPKKVNYLKWGDDGFSADLPSGYDVRDYITAEGKCTSIVERGNNVTHLFELVEPIPSTWVAGVDPKKKGSVELQPKECTEWKVLRTAFQKAMQWTDGMDICFSVMLASIASVKVQEDQIWIKCCSPPSTGKTSLCNALAVAKKWICSRSHIRGVMSGYKSDKTGAEDFGLIPKIRDKTLVVKDGDTLLQAPNLDKILAELRDLYDTNTSSHFLQGAGREYVGVRTTIILCGTSSLRTLDDSELGQRFLDCTIMDQIDEELEDDICDRAMRRLDLVKSIEANGKTEAQQSKAMTLAMQLTGGYIDYLRKNVHKQLEDVQLTDEQHTHIKHMGKFIAHMRARPSRKQKETQGREMASRLCLQLKKLAYCLTVVLNKTEVDDEVLRRVHKVCMDTSKGRSLTICRHLYRAGEEGVEGRYLSTLTNQTFEEERTFLRFMRQIGVVEVCDARGKSSRSYWRLTKKFHHLYSEVMGTRTTVKG